MEYAEAGTLGDRIAERETSMSLWDEDDLLDIFTQVCLAVKYSH